MPRVEKPSHHCPVCGGPNYFVRSIGFRPFCSKECAAKGTGQTRKNPPALPVFVVGAPGGARKASRGGADKIATRNKKQAFAIAYARSRAAGNARVGIYSHGSEAIALRRWGPQLRIARGQVLPAIVAAQVAAFGRRL